MYVRVSVRVDQLERAFRNELFQLARSFLARTTDFVKQSIKVRCLEIYGSPIVAFPARKQVKFMRSAWIIRFRSEINPCDDSSRCL